MSGSYSYRHLGDWDCPKCKELIFASKSMCFKCKVDKYGNSKNLTKIGDWNCPKCHDYQFARNSNCRKCGTSKPSSSNIDSANSNSVNTPSVSVRTGDWLCPGCQDLQFARNTHCRKCKMLNPKLAVKTVQQTEQAKEDDEKLCSICLDANKNMLLLHVTETEGHLCCCEPCANELIADGAPCPICRQNIKQAIKVF
jgi:hypothetical protein